MPMRAPLNLGDHASLARRIVGELVGSAGIRVLGMAVSFLVGVQLARYLGPGGYGMYGTAMAIAALVAVPAQMGLPQLITRELSVTVARRDARAAKTLLLWFTAIVAAASLVVSALGLAGLLLWSDVDATLRRAIGWGLATVPIMALLSLAGGALRGLHDVVTAQAFDAAIRPLGLAALLASVAIVASIDAATAMALHALAALLALVMSVQRVRRVTPHAVRVAPVTRFDRSMVRGSGAMFGTEALRVLDGQYAVLLLGLIATAEEVGWYRAAIAVAVFMALPLTIVNLVVMPHVARLHAQSDLRRLQLVASGAAVAMLSVATVVTLAVYFLGEQLLVALFGHDFLPVWEPLILMCVAYTVSAFFGAAAIVLTMVGQERMVMAVHLVGPVVGVCLTLALFATLGISAAAIGMIVAEAIKGAWLAQVARRKLGLDVTLLSAGSLRNRG